LIFVGLAKFEKPLKRKYRRYRQDDCGVEEEGY
jgi:hypothetical protein